MQVNWLSPTFAYTIYGLRVLATSILIYNIDSFNGHFGTSQFVWSFSFGGKNYIGMVLLGQQNLSLCGS